MTDASWDDLPLSERARDVVHHLGWKEPTPIQVLAVPQLKMGRDIIGRAETGSGKTAAFGLVMTDTLKAPGLQALVLAPTRELAQQIAAELNALAAGAPFRAVAVYGGVPYDPQLEALRDPRTTCAVCTTGRLLDLLARKQVRLDDVRFVVLDEADRMLDLGFLPEVERVLRLIPGGRQTALFSATMPKKVAQLAHQTMAHPREIEVGPQTPETAEHYRLDVTSENKMLALLALLEKERPKRAILFTRTRDAAAKLARELQARHMAAAEFSGDLDQTARERVVEDLKAGRVTLVVATDVAARGLHVPGITHVINVDVPEETEQYVHRAGRTARAGKEGRVFTLVTENEGRAAKAAEDAASMKWRIYPLGDLTSARPTPIKKEMAGGNALGVQRKKAHVHLKPQDRPARPEPDPDRAPPRGERFDLPPSRRRKDDDPEG